MASSGSHNATDASPNFSNSASAAPEARLCDVFAPTLYELGEKFAEAYRVQAQGGLKRSWRYYVDVEPVTCTDDQWRCLARNACLAAEKCCPAATAFLKGVTEGLTRDAYLSMLDFELYALEAERQAQIRAAKRNRARAKKACQEAAACERSQAEADGKASDCEEATTDSDCSSSSSSSICSNDSIHRISSNGNAAQRNESGVDTSEPGTSKTAKHVAGLVERIFRSGPFRRRAVVRSNGPTVAHECGAEQPERQPTKCEAEGRCTGFALSTSAADTPESSGMVVAQAIDLPLSLYAFGDQDMILRLATPKCAMLAYDCDGRLCPVGLNSAGLGIAVFNFHQSPAFDFEKTSLPVQVILWELLLGNHTVASAVTWLQQMGVPVMCGSALLLADSSGAVMVELSPAGPPAVSNVRRDEPIVRANHPVMANHNATYGGTGKARRCSERRQKRLEVEISARLEGKLPSALDGIQALDILAASKKVRNISTMACLACDVYNRRLYASMRERHIPSDEVVDGLLDLHQVSVGELELVLEMGACEGVEDGPRLTTGQEVPHLFTWRTHSYGMQSPARAYEDPVP